VNGNFVPYDEAKISIFDRGYLFGDSVYEVVPVYNSQVCFLKQHMNRLFSSLSQCKIEKPDYDWHTIIDQLISENGGGDLQVYIQVSRGHQAVRKHDIPIKIEPTVTAFTLHTPFSSDETKITGLNAVLLNDFRWQKCQIKANSLLANILLNDMAVSNGYDTAILYRDNIITEGATSNVFIIDKDNTVKTPTVNDFCLPGITRIITIKLLNQLNIKVVEGTIKKDEIMSAQEVWITSTTKEIHPVSAIDNKTIGHGKPGLLWNKLNKLYKKLVKHENGP